MTTFRMDMTLAEAKNELRKHVDEGTRCPTCTQLAKVYRRTITKGAAAALVTMYRTVGRGWLHVPSTPGLARQGGEIARLRFWGLVEESTSKRDDGGRVGWWRITEAGEHWLAGHTSLPKHARIYDGRCLGFDGTRSITINDALGARFDLSELMGR